MNARRFNAVVWIFFMIFVNTCGAEFLDLFKASVEGPEAWTWGGARIEEFAGSFVITEHNKAGGYGDVWITQSFPYLSEGIIAFDVDRVIRGSYTVQVLAFKGNKHLQTYDLVTKAKSTRAQRFDLSSIDFREGTDTLLFKIWVVDAQRASIRLKEFIYGLSYRPDDVLFDERFQDAMHWVMDSMAFTALDQGASLEVSEDVSLASMESVERILYHEKDRILFHADMIDKGRMSVQLVVFDGEGNYLGSVDLIKEVESGWHSARLNEIAWPSLGRQYALKLWLSGGSDAHAKVSRLMVIKN